MKLRDGQKIVIQGRADHDGHFGALEEDGKRGPLAMGETVEATLKRLAGEIQRLDIDVPDPLYQGEEATAGAGPSQAVGLARNADEDAADSLTGVAGATTPNDAPDLSGATAWLGLPFKSSRSDGGKLLGVSVGRGGGPKRPKVFATFVAPPPHELHDVGFYLDPDDAVAFGQRLVSMAEKIKAGA